jgi:anti-sigma regulatory factor (Ser/Thr protein kinase)
LSGAVDEPVREDVLLLVSELCTNAIQATSRRGDKIVVRVDLTDSDVVVEVEDSGSGFAFPDHVAANQDESGRGLAIARRLAKHVEIDRRDERTCVRARLRRDEALQLSGDFK